MGIVYLEASASGLPVIAGKSGGAPDAVLNNKTGVVVDGTDIDAISKACIALLSNPRIAKEYGDTILPRPKGHMSADGIHPTGRGYKILGEQTK